jgi:hypothetical protein
MARSPGGLAVTAVALHLMRTCAECGSEFHGRSDARYCSPTCRQAAYRQRHRPYRPEPIGCMTDLGLKIATPKRLRTALNLFGYDAHQSADELRDELGPHASEWADWIDDTVEWLSVVRDGLRGMDQNDRIVASIVRTRRSVQR